MSGAVTRAIGASRQSNASSAMMAEISAPNTQRAIVLMHDDDPACPRNRFEKSIFVERGERAEVNHFHFRAMLGRILSAACNVSCSV